MQISEQQAGCTLQEYTYRCFDEVSRNHDECCAHGCSSVVVAVAAGIVIAPSVVIIIVVVERGIEPSTAVGVVVVSAGAAATLVAKARRAGVSGVAVLSLVPGGVVGGPLLIDVLELDEVFHLLDVVAVGRLVVAQPGQQQCIALVISSCF